MRVEVNAGDSLSLLCMVKMRGILCFFTNPNNPSESVVNQAHSRSVFDTCGGNYLIYLLDVLKAFRWSESTWTPRENTDPALRPNAVGSCPCHTEIHIDSDWTQPVRKPLTGLWGQVNEKSIIVASLTVFSFI